jgi:hypothetical protein
MKKRGQGPLIVHIIDMLEGVQPSVPGPGLLTAKEHIKGLHAADHLTVMVNHLNERVEQASIRL